MGMFRKTKQSSLILDIINNSKDHLTAYDIYKKCLLEINNISLGTVYRNLNNLVDTHQIRKIIDFNGLEHFDNIIVPHYHFLCLKCGYIGDIYNKIDIPLECNFGKVMSYEIVYYGICHNCCKEEN